MTNPNKLADRRPPKAAFVHRVCRGWRAALSSFAVFALTGCGLSDGAGALFVDPGRYTLYHCDDLAAPPQSAHCTRERTARTYGQAKAPAAP